MLSGCVVLNFENPTSLYFVFSFYELFPSHLNFKTSLTALKQRITSGWKPYYMPYNMIDTEQLEPFLLDSRLTLALTLACVSSSVDILLCPASSCPAWIRLLAGYARSCMLLSFCLSTFLSLREQTLFFFIPFSPLVQV